MKLKTSLKQDVHSDMVTSCTWDPNNELYTVSDDRTVHKWNMDQESLGKFSDIEAYATDMDWCPSLGKQASDVFAVACSDGTFRIFSSGGREDKKIEAHKGCAVISIRWSNDASAIVTSGEDGTVKVWSRVGMLRNTIQGNGHPIYSALWGPDDDQILYTGGRQLIIKTLQKDRKQVQWKAHDKTVLSVDWNPITSLIVSGGEDCRYRVWDSYGRQLYQSQPFEQVVTAVRWSPNGDYFAAGSFNVLRLCDKNGWSYSRDEVKSGSILSLSWSGDSTMVSGAGANGSVVFGQIIDRSMDWKHVNAHLTNVDQIVVTECLKENSDYSDTLEFRDRVLEFNIAFNHLVVACASQIHVYNLDDLASPHMIDIPKNASVNVLVLSARYFAVTDNIRGVTIYTYEGRKVSNPVFPGMRVELLNKKTMSLSSDTIAILDKSDGKSIRVMDASSGRPIGAGKIAHNLEIVEIHLSQMDKSLNRYVLFIDRNRDLYIAPITSDPKDTRKCRKLHTMVDSAAWNDTSDLLVALSDGNLVTWYHPQSLWVDSDLIPIARTEKEVPEFGKLPSIISFFGNQVVVRHADGSNLTASISPYPAMLHEFVKASSMRWEDAVRLCRLVDSRALWATLAGMAIQGRHLDTAEIALAAIDLVDKLHYILYIKDIPSEKGRMAELAFYRKDLVAAEQILLHASPPLLYRAIKMNIRACRWERALELAVNKNKHIDTVLWYRAKYLHSLNLNESIPVFNTWNEKVEVDEEQVKANKAKEKADEIRKYGDPNDLEDDDEEEEAEDDDGGHK